jgi:SAM-dependent methyltransferase
MTLIPQLARRAKSALLARTLAFAYEQRFGIHTSDVIMEDAYAAQLANEGSNADNLVGHLASSWLTLPRILRQDEVSTGDVFLDVGCGEGRMLIEAAHHYPFRRVIGLEISEAIAETARQNAADAQRHLRAPVDVFSADAARCPIPPEVTVIYLFNPFRGPVFASFTERLVESLRARPRRLRVIYALPREEQMLLETGLFRRVRIGKGIISPVRRHDYLSLYETIAPAEAV